MDSNDIKIKNLVTKLRVGGRDTDEEQRKQSSEELILSEVLGGPKRLSRIMRRELRRFKASQPKKWANWIKSMAE